MAANTTPIFTIIPICPAQTVSAANTNRDGTGTIVDIVTGDTDGTRIDLVVIQAAVTTTAGMIRLYIWNTSVYNLFFEQAITAITPSASVAAFRAEVFRNDGRPLVVLPSGWKLGASTHNAEAFRVHAIGGDFS